MPEMLTHTVYDLAYYYSSRPLKQKSHSSPCDGFTVREAGGKPL